MTDEQCIAMAWLHGATFFNGAAGAWWVVIDPGFHEYMRCTYPDNSPAYNRDVSKSAAARGYCKRHGLLEETP